MQIAAQSRSRVCSGEHMPPPAARDNGWLQFGWDAEDPYPYDAQVAATAIRDGNYDYLNNEQRWLTSAPESLPYSFYLASKPAFFGPNPWPWVDPTTGTTYTLPAKARFDAGTPNIVP